ncbi:hypothetical protein ACOME3_003931 [Neoechinorhynchus agilis]
MQLTQFQMPLIILCGFPLSGKTEVAKLLAREFGEQIEVVRLSDEDFINKEAGDEHREESRIYSDNNEEKRCRSYLKSLVAKQIGKKNLIILDSLNYIKGYRYELRCLTLLYKTRQFTVFCDCSLETIRKRNEQSKKYSGEILDEIVERFEIPQSLNKTDLPLYVVNCNLEKPVLSSEMLNDLHNLLLKKPLKGPNKCTLSIPFTNEDTLQYAGRMTSSIILQIHSKIKEISTCENFVDVPIQEDGFTSSIEIPVGPNGRTTITVVQLTKMRQQFLKMLQQRPLIPEPGKDIQLKIKEAFVKFLKSHIDSLALI